MSPAKPFNVLFLCTGNSARSILSEALLNHWGDGRFRAYSAGSQPVGRVNPLTIETLRSVGLPVEGLRSKSWDEFAGADAPQMDFIITVCSNAAGEVCPVWPGHPATAHWDFDDPAAAEGTDAERLREFHRVFHEIQARVQLFSQLRLEELSQSMQRQLIQLIGKLELTAEAKNEEL